MRRLLALASMAFLTLSACTDESPPETAWPATWQVPDDFCERVDLAALLDGAGIEEVRDVRSDQVDGGAMCVAAAEHLTVETQAVTTPDAEAGARSFASAEAAVTKPEAWESLGPVEASSPTPPGEWSRQLSGMWVGRERLEEAGAVRILRVDALAHDNVVVRLTVSGTVPAEESTEALDRVPALADDVVTAVRASLDEG